MSELSDLKEEVRILKQYHELGTCIITCYFLHDEIMRNLLDAELMTLHKEYKEFLYRKDHPHE